MLTLCNHSVKSALRPFRNSGLHRPALGQSEIAVTTALGAPDALESIPPGLVTKVTLCKIFQAWRTVQVLVYWKHNATKKVAYLLQNTCHLFLLSCAGVVFSA